MQKEWTFLVFVNGNNNLDIMGEKNIKAMEKIGSNEHINIVVQWASLKTRKSLRLLVEKSNDPTKVSSPILQDLGLVDMGDYHALEDFIQWGVQHFPAKHYFITVWNHGNGWHIPNQENEKRCSSNVANDISYDDISGHVITTQQLGWVMTYMTKLIGHKIDIYGSDACLMSVAEVADEMSDEVNVFVGSQENEPSEGWPYDDFLAGWEATPNADAKTIAKILVDVYVAWYLKIYPEINVTFSAIDLNQINIFKQKLKKLGEEIRQLPPATLVKLFAATKAAQSFGYNNDYKDVIDVMQQLLLISLPSTDLQLIKEVQESAKQMIIANKAVGSDKHASGLSLWLPHYPLIFEEYRKQYANLKFAKQTDWEATLQSLLSAPNAVVT